MFWLLGGIVLLLLVLTAFLITLVATRENVENYLGEITGFPVQIERINLEWSSLSPLLDIEGFEIRPPDSDPAKAREPLLALPQLQLRVDLTDLVTRGALRVKSIILENPRLRATHEEDGRVTFAGFSTVTSDGQVSEPIGLMVNLLAQVERVQIRGGELIWSEKRGPVNDIRFTAIAILAKRSGSGFDVQLQSQSPDMLQSDIKMTARIQPPSSGKGFNGEVELITENIGIERIQALLQGWGDFALTPIIQGEANLQLKIAKQQGSPLQIEGYVDLEEVGLATLTDEQGLLVDRFTGYFAFRPEETGWQMTFQPETVELDRQEWELGEFEIRQRDEELRISVARLDIGGVSAKLATLAKGKKGLIGALGKLTHSGAAEELKIILPQGWMKKESFKVRGSVSNFGQAGGDQFPGFSNLSGRFEATASSGRFQFKADRSSIALTGGDSPPVENNRLGGTLSWVLQEDKAVVTVPDLVLANDDLDLGADLTLHLPLTSGAKVWVDLSATLDEMSASRVPGYLAGRIPPKLYLDLAQLFQGGVLTQGALRLKGAPSDYPFASSSEGVLSLKARAEGVTLNYDDEWPRVTELGGQLEINNDRLSFVASEGKIGGVSLVSGELALPSLVASRPDLQLRTTLSGKVAPVIRFLQQGPLLPSLKEKLDLLSGRGSGDLLLDLSLPLTDPEALEVNGRYRFTGSELHYGDRLTLSRLQGDLDFTREGVTSDHIRAELFGGEVHLVVTHQTPHHYQIKAKGSADLAEVDAILGDSMPTGVTGSAAWEGVLDLQREQQKLAVTTTLVGVESSLPPPLNKSSEEAVPLALNLEWGEQERVSVGLTVDEREVMALLEFNNVDQGWHLHRGNIGLGKPIEAMAETEGVNIEVALPHFDFDPWIAMINSEGESRLRQIKGEIQQAQLMGREFGALIFDLQFLDRERQRMTLGGDRAEGVFNWVMGDQGWQIEGRMTRLDWPGLPESESDEGPEPERDALDPRRFASLNLQIEDLRYRGRTLGELALRGVSVGTGIHFEKIALTGNEATLEGEGSWLIQNQSQRTQLSGKVASANFGNTLTELGFTDNLRGGDGELDIALTWEGSPDEISFKKLGGEYSFSLREGTFPKVESGGGRLFGLFNFNALARRFTLDFTDLFREGLVFDNLRGTGVIEGGDFISEGIILAGPSTFMDIRGRVDLENERYDLKLIVVPQVGGNLVTLGFMSGPQVGLAVLLTQKALQHLIGEVIQYHYQISGSWAEPEVTRVERQSINDDRSNQN